MSRREPRPPNRGQSLTFGLADAVVASFVGKSICLFIAVLMNRKRFRPSAAASIGPLRYPIPILILEFATAVLLLVQPNAHDPGAISDRRVLGKVFDGIGSKISFDQIPIVLCGLQGWAFTTVGDIGKEPVDLVAASLHSNLPPAGNFATAVDGFNARDVTPGIFSCHE
jgi:hypothetical protein